MMVAVAIAAVLINHFRPISKDEAIHIAVAYTKRSEPQYDLTRFRAHAFWVDDGYYVVVWENPADENDTRTPVNLFVNTDGRCTEFTGSLRSHYDQEIKRLILDKYLPLSKTPFENVK